jgi:hypothetical protein
MEKDLEEYCMEQMSIYGGAYTIHEELNVVAIYKGDIQELDVLSFKEVLEELRESA